MKRLCIYVTYNKENIIKDYMGYMLEALSECVTTIYMVCNYKQISEGLEFVAPYVDDIFYRENKGYDAGAYKDMLCSLIGWDKVYEYDELVLVNDSFMGPFYGLDKYFDIMEDRECDFWGMTRNFSGTLEPLGYSYRPHVHSYFWVFKDHVLKSSVFRDYWENLLYPEFFLDAVLKYEIKLNECLEEAGFTSLAFTDVWGMEFESNEIAFHLYAYELIKEKKFPLLKKKSFLIRNKGFENTLKAIGFLEEKKLYPTQWIWELLDGQFNRDGYSIDNPNCLEQFKDMFNKIYIYGAGLCGKNLKTYFALKKWKCEGFVVSDKCEQDINCEVFDAITVDEQTGIIVSVQSPEVAAEIVKYIGNRCTRKQLFLISDCPAIRVPR